jgi:hypothetical protein
MQPLNKAEEDAYVTVVQQAMAITNRAVPSPLVAELRAVVLRAVLSDILGSRIITRDGLFEAVD